MAPAPRPRLAVALAVLLLAPPAARADDGPTAQDPPAPAPSGMPEGAPADAAPADPVFEAHVAVAGGDDIRVRAGPSIDYRVLDRLAKGTWVIVTGREGDFAKVRIPGGIPVFVSAELVELSPDGKSGSVARSDVLMRPTAGQEYFPLEGQKLQQGDAVSVLGREKGESGEWLKVLPPARVEYYIAASLLERVGAEGEKAEELARITLERRDGYTGGKEAEAAREVVRKREEGLAALVEAAAAALAKAPAATLPADSEARRADLGLVMTESGVPANRRSAERVSRDYLVRERDMKVAEARAEKATVTKDLETRIAEVEAQYRRAVDDLLKTSPRAAGPKYRAVGTLRRGAHGGFEVVKGGIVLHRVDSLRYELGDMVGLRVGVNGKDISVDPAKGLVVLRVDALEILE